MDKYAYIFVIIVALALVLYEVYNIFQKNKNEGTKAALDELRDYTYHLFLRAEKRYGKNAGGLKMSFVVANLYKALTPDQLQEFMPTQTIEIYVQKLYDKVYTSVKDYLNDGIMNGNEDTYVENPTQCTKEKLTATVEELITSKAGNTIDEKSNTTEKNTDTKEAGEKPPEEYKDLTEPIE